MHKYIFCYCNCLHRRNQTTQPSSGTDMMKKYAYFTFVPKDAGICSESTGFSLGCLHMGDLSSPYGGASARGQSVNGGTHEGGT